MLLIASLISASAVAPSTAPSANSLAAAEKGQLQCYRPDVAKKTCQSIAAYRRTGPGTYDNKAVIPLGNDATLETHSPVAIRDNAVCGFIEAENLASGTLRVGGRVVAPEDAKPILERVVQGMQPLLGKEICTSYEPSDSDFTAKVSIAGNYKPDLDVTVKWISPSDGYAVKP